jgi:glycosyltransferase involved in cell wall biosynthesis
MSKKALMVGPNIGISMGKGGGVRVAAKMGEVLAENSYEVSFCALKGYSLNLLDAVHGTKLFQYKGRIRTHYLINSSRGSGAVEGFSGALPIHVGVLPFSLYLRYVLRTYSPHLLIFHDDIPLLKPSEFRDRYAMLYVHFSYATRLKLGVGDITETTTSSKQCIEELLNPVVKRLIFFNSNPANMIIANSSITADFLKQTWNGCDVQTLHPPVDTDYYALSRGKENLVVAVGVIQPNKRFEDIIRAMSKVSSEYRLVITGYRHQSNYYLELQRLIDITGLRGRVEIVLDATREELRDTLSKAKIAVHASRFEPFGISVVEGMASGCVPIVYRGATSGPWVDIINRGEFGIGFRTIDELSENIEKIMNNERMYRHYGIRAMKRSKEFDTLVFKDKFTKILSRIGY